MGSTDSKIAKIQTNFQALSEIAPSINSASNELTKVVGKLDEALKKLNVGLSDWVTFVDRLPHEDMQYDVDQIGYTKVDGKWGIALRHIWGHEAYDDHQEEGPWLFGDAPREMRLRSVDKIPELIGSLSKKASDTVKKIQEKTKEVSELAAAIESAANEAKRKSPTPAEKVTATTLVDLIRKANKANAGTVAVPGGEFPKAKEGSK